MPSTKEYFCLQPSKFRLDGGAMFGIIPKPLWQKVAPPDDQNRIDLALRLWLIKTKDRVILVDTGIGDYHGEKFEKRFDVRTQRSPLEKSLAELSLSTSDVTDLVISHLHFDHVGGIGHQSEDGMQPVFKNATLHLHKNHFDYAYAPTDRDSGSFQVKNFDPVINYYKDRDKISWHEGEQGELIPEADLKFKCSHGHTPFLMHPYDDKLIYLADLIPTSNHVHIPWVMGYDISPGITTKDKKEFLALISQKDLVIIYEHDPLYWGSSIKTDERFGFTPNKTYETMESLAFELKLD
jgi:glyoxylase-like metal-dependent hydrolase (beta-lactamase superfamily II)